MPTSLTHLSFQDQLGLLQRRGLTVTDCPTAIRHLERTGYYRLKSYLVPLRQTRLITFASGKPATEILEGYRAGTEFKHAVDLYVFDKKLRTLMMDAIERIEVAFRVDLAHAVGSRDPWAHRNSSHLDPSLSNAPDRHPEWLAHADKLEARSRVDWITDIRKAHGALPIWMAVETWDFGTLASFSEMAHRVDRATISTKYGLPNARMMSSWLRTLGYVRNICAHHDRLWNHPLVIQPMIPKKGEVPRLDHLSTYIPTQTRVYAAAAISQHLLDSIAPGSSWKRRLRYLWNTFPAIPGVTPLQAGFMPTWRNLALWV